MDLVKKVYEDADVVWSGKYHTTVNELTDQVPALRPKVLWEAALKLSQLGSFDGDKILCEEDKGVIMGTVVSLITGIPLAVAREYRYELPNSLKMDYDSEYMAGSLYINGIQPGDRVTIIDDTISTGGTLIALINGVRKIGAEVIEVVVLTEKVDNKGVERVRKETGVEVKTSLKITVRDGKVQVVE